MLRGAAGCIRSELCQRCANAICRERPVALVVILDRVHEAIIAITQFDPLAIVRQLAIVRPSECDNARLSPQRGGVTSHDQMLPGRDDGTFGKRKLNTVRETPSRNVHVHAHLIVEFNELGGCRVRRVIHDLIEHDGAVQDSSWFK